MMYEGRHIHYSPLNNRPLCSYSGKLCRQRRVNGFAFCIRHILEDKTAPFKQCAHVAKYNSQKCTNPIPTNEERDHMQVAGMAPKRDRKAKKDKDPGAYVDGRLKFSERVRVLLPPEASAASDVGADHPSVDDPYVFRDNAAEAASDGVLSRAPLHPCLPRGPDHGSRFGAESPGSPPASEKPKQQQQQQQTPRTSKTMNKLQAKIAQNKLLDKLKRNQESSPGVEGSSPPVGQDVSSGATLPGDPLPKRPASRSQEASDLSPTSVDLASHELPREAFSHSQGGRCGGSVVVPPRSGPGPARLQHGLDHSHLRVLPPSPRPPCARVVAPPEALPSRLSPGIVPGTRSRTQGLERVVTVAIRPKEPKSRCVWKRPEAVSREVLAAQLEWSEIECLRADHYPLGPESSDSESSDSDCDAFQRHWLSSWKFKDPVGSPSDLGTLINRQYQIRSNLRRQVTQLSRAQQTARGSHRPHCHMWNMVVEAAKVDPFRAGQMLQALTSRGCGTKSSSTKRECLGLVKKKCCYSNEAGTCLNMALPYTRHCIKHIMYNVDQLLFEHCTAKFADNTQCCIPVFDISHELPLCLEHARKRDNYNKMSSEPKPKKPRKKTKPSALTRPPKRGKKKKKQVTSGPLKSPAFSSADDSPTSFKFNVHAQEMIASDGCLNNEELTDDVNVHLQSDIGHELAGPLSPESIEKSLGIPMDAVELDHQATHLLEEHDFTEVLNKIPDDAFNDLFAEHKNGDFLPTKEETEAFVRAFVSANKDNKPLDKLSSEAIVDLGGSMEIQENLLHGDHLGSTIGSSLAAFTQGSINMDNLSAIASTLTSSELNSISQALSSMTSESGVHLTGQEVIPISHCTLTSMGLMSDVMETSTHTTTSTVGCIPSMANAFGLHLVPASDGIRSEDFSHVYARGTSMESSPLGVAPHPSLHLGPRGGPWLANSHAGPTNLYPCNNGLVLNLQAFTHHTESGLDSHKAALSPKDEGIGFKFPHLMLQSEPGCLYGQGDAESGIVTKLKRLPSADATFPSKDVTS